LTKSPFTCEASSILILSPLRFRKVVFPLKHFSLIWGRHNCRWSAAKFRPMLGAQGLWAGRDLYLVTPTVIRDLGISGLIWSTTLFSRQVWHTMGCGWSILTRILPGRKILRQEK
jgi:hypothetical protein